MVVDTDVLILRKDQLAMQDYLKDWVMYKTSQPGLKSWKKGEYLEIGVNSVWCKKVQDSPWALQIMFMDSEDDEWFFRRNPIIRGKISELGLITDSGIPYLKPEIQLMYKAKKKILQKDKLDFQNTIDKLDYNSLIWLINALQKQFAENHLWINEISKKLNI